MGRLRSGGKQKHSQPRQPPHGSVGRLVSVCPSSPSSGRAGAEPVAGCSGPEKPPAAGCEGVKGPGAGADGLEGDAPATLQAAHDFALQIVRQKPAMALQIGGDLTIGPTLPGLDDGIKGAPPQWRGRGRGGASALRIGYWCRSVCSWISSVSGAQPRAILLGSGCFPQSGCGAAAPCSRMQDLMQQARRK